MSIRGVFVGICCLAFFANSCRVTKQNNTVNFTQHPPQSESGTADGTKVGGTNPSIPGNNDIVGGGGRKAKNKLARARHAATLAAQGVLALPQHPNLCRPINCQHPDAAQHCLQVAHRPQAQVSFCQQFLRTRGQQLLERLWSIEENRVLFVITEKEYTAKYADANGAIVEKPVLAIVPNPPTHVEFGTKALLATDHTEVVGTTIHEITHTMKFGDKHKRDFDPFPPFNSFGDFADYIASSVALFQRSVIDFPPGTADKSFANTGRATLSLGEGVQGGFTTSSIVDSYGRVLTYGHYTDLQNKLHALIHRTLPNGKPDLTFGNQGHVLFRVNQGDSAVDALAINKEGQLIILGRHFPPPHQFRHIMLARLNSDGSLDETFGDNGVTLSSQWPNGFEQPTSLAIQQDEKLVFSGYGSPTAYTQGKFQAILGRTDADGHFDPSFGTSGRVNYNVGGFGKSTAQDLTLLDNPDGTQKIFFIGNYFTGSLNSAFCGRLLPDGSLDTSFPNGGLNAMPHPGGLPSNAFSIAKNSDGSILIAGSVLDQDWDVLIRKLRPDFYYEQTFGNQGVKQLVRRGSDEFAYTIALDGNIHFAISGDRQSTNLTQAITVFFNPDGTPNTLFGSGGWIIEPKPSHGRGIVFSSLYRSYTRTIEERISANERSFQLLRFLTTTSGDSR